VLLNIHHVAGLFLESAFIFVENDSRDQTKQNLEIWGERRKNFNLICLDGLAASCPVRTMRLATVRNRYVSLILQSELRRYDYLFVLDLDNVNAMEVRLDPIKSALDFLETATSRAGVFANQDGPYYDMWALRHPGRCPSDIWEEVFDYAATHQVSDEEAFNKTFKRRIFSLPTDCAPLEVESAFGGLGIYKLSYILRNKRFFVGHKKKIVQTPDGTAEIGWQVCEHVNFHQGIRELGGQLFILPYLVNCQTHGTWFPPWAYRTMVFSPAPG
jgi:hypothetical protein